MDDPNRLATNTNEDEIEGRKRLAANTNEDELEDDVEAHRLAPSAHEDGPEDSERSRRRR